MTNSTREIMEKKYTNLQDTIDYLVGKDRLLEALLILYSEIDSSLNHIVYSCKKGEPNVIDINRLDEIINLKTSVKIRLIYALNCIGEPVYYDLENIRKLRNKFSHQLRMKFDFEDNLSGSDEKTNKFFEEVKQVLKEGVNLIKKLDK
jgi:hypothetical protein